MLRNPSLKNKLVIVTRAQDQQGECKQLFKELGARVLDFPSLIIGPPIDWKPLDNSLQELDSFHWIIFSSSNGVNAVYERLKKKELSLSSLPITLKIAAVGRKTADALNKKGVKVDFIPPDFVADSLIDNFPVSGAGLRILLPRVQTGGRTILAEAFNAAGSDVIEVPAYESICPKTIPEETVVEFRKHQVDLLTFTSAKTALHVAKLLQKYFGDQWLQEIRNVKLISIGPQTSKSCRKYFKRVDQEATPHDVNGLVEACIKAMH
tara:strand:- start:7045 stop:7839 length:795 start_codon:yes stop_codon:yes gene_type:complete